MIDIYLEIHAANLFIHLRRLQVELKYIVKLPLALD